MEENMSKKNYEDKDALKAATPEQIKEAEKPVEQPAKVETKVEVKTAKKSGGPCV